MKRFEGDFDVNASPQEVMDYISDLQNIVPALPGLVEIKEVKAGAGIVLVDAGVSFIKGRFTVRIEQMERNTDYLKFRGHGDGIGNAVDFESTVKVVGASDKITTVYWESDVRVNGQLASMGAGLLNPVINQNVELFVDTLKSGIEGNTAQMMDYSRLDAAKTGFWERILGTLSRLIPDWLWPGKRQR